MSSWYQLMLLNMTKGHYLRLGKRPPTEYDWVVLWNLMGEQSVVSLGC